MTQFTVALLRLVRLWRVVRVFAEVRTAPAGDPSGARALAAAYRAAASEAAEFTAAATALDEYATALAAAQAQHATGSGIRARRRAHTAALLAADRLARRCGDLAGRARLAAGVSAGLTPAEAHALASAARGGYDSGVLGPQHLRLAGARLAGFDPTQRAKIDALLSAAASPLERAWLVKALAVIDDITDFAEAVRGKPPEWLATRLTLVDRHAPTAQIRLGAAVRQYEATTCGTTCLIVARAEHDPRYALALTTGDFATAFRAARAAVHDETNRWYPQAAGTSPRGMATWLTRHLGPRHRWRLVDDRDPRDVSRALRDVLAAVDDGHPVPVLVGAVVPRHYVLVVGHHDGSVLVFEPTAGRTVAVPDQAFLDGDLAGALGFAHLQAVVLPDQAGQPLSAGRAAFGSK